MFENVNTGGVSLIVFELITATYEAESETFELRKDWDKRNAEFISKSELGGNDTDNAVLASVSATDFLIAATLYSRYKIRQAGGEAVSCKRKDF